MPLLCPACGSTIDDRPSATETTTNEYLTTLASRPPPEAATPWIETWRTGTLGTVGRFQLRELLGDGAFGQVFQAYDPRLDRDVALKVLKQPDPGERVMQRFFREARAVARLHHPNIVTIYDAGRDAGRCWIAYQFVAGRPLSRLRDRQRMDRTTAVRIIRDLADALDHAHRQEVFHRDLKPGNVILDAQGRPHLTDFGLSRRADLTSDLTRDGGIIGTPAYMSPEQAGGRSHQADERSDIYSLGIMFFELLCGQRPVNLPSEAPAWAAQPGSPPPPPRSIDRTIPRVLDRVCSKALAVDPEHRYPNARALADDLDAWLRREDRSVRALPRMLGGALIGGVTSLLLMVGVSALLWPATPRAGPGRQAVVSVPNARLTDAVAFIGNKHTRKYHRAGCEEAHKISAENVVGFATAAEARAKNFEPCKKCLREGAGGGDPDSVIRRPD